MLQWIAFLQAVAGPPAPREPLRRSDAPCRPATQPDEIVVCAPTDERYRLKPLPDRYAAVNEIPRAEKQIAPGTTLGVEAEQGADAQGGAINRAMVRLKMRF